MVPDDKSGKVELNKPADFRFLPLKITPGFLGAERLICGDLVNPCGDLVNLSAQVRKSIIEEEALPAEEAPFPLPFSAFRN